MSGKKKKATTELFGTMASDFVKNLAVRYLIKFRIANCRAFSGSSFNFFHNY